MKNKIKIKEVKRDKAIDSAGKYFIYHDDKNAAIEVPARVKKVLSAILEMEPSNSLLIRDSIANALQISNLKEKIPDVVDTVLRKNLLTLFRAECIQANLQNISYDDVQYLIDFFTYCPSGYEVSQLILPHVELKPVYT